MIQQTSDDVLARMMALHPKIIDLTLDRMWRLLDALGNPQNNLPPVIHIAGTNGKGSTQAMIRAGLESAGHRVHAYTSPHLARFHERIRVAGDLITEADLTAVLDECYAANNGGNITYFEITTCAALLAFSRTPADYTLLEVGLGGRLDATNVIDTPALTVITPVSIDHQQYLGDTLGQIAGEKAGIIKRRVPCVVGPQQDEAMDVIEAEATRHHVPLLAYGQQWHVGPEAAWSIRTKKVCWICLGQTCWARIRLTMQGQPLPLCACLASRMTTARLQSPARNGPHACSASRRGPWSKPLKTLNFGWTVGITPQPERQLLMCWHQCPNVRPI